MKKQKKKRLIDTGLSPSAVSPETGAKNIQGGVSVNEEMQDAPYGHIPDKSNQPRKDFQEGARDVEDKILHQKVDRLEGKIDLLQDELLDMTKKFENN